MKLIFEECIGSYWHILLLACVPQFDTMHPRLSLGANFSDRNFNTIWQKDKKMAWGV